MYVERERIVAWACIITLAIFTLFVAGKATADVPRDFEKGYVQLEKKYGGVPISVCKTEADALEVLKGKTFEEQAELFKKSANCTNTDFSFVPVRILKEFPGGTLVLIRNPVNKDETRVWMTRLEVRTGEWV